MEVAVARDLNGNGVVDPGEPVITATTTVTGYYVVGNLGPGNYVVTVNPDDPNLLDGFSLETSSIAVTLPANTSVTTADFPLVQVLTKQVSAITSTVGSRLTYTITANYPGPDLVENAVVVDPIPNKTGYFTSSVNAGGIYSTSYDFGAGPSGIPAVQWSLGSNTPGIPGIGAPVGSAYCPATTTLSILDTYLDGSSTNNALKNFGATTSLDAKKGELFPLLRFDLTSIPAGSVIRSAKLGLYVSSKQSAHLDKLYPMYANTWVVGTSDNAVPAPGAGATHNSPIGTTTVRWAGGGNFGPADYEATSVGALAPVVSGKYATTDISLFVQQVVNGQRANNGLAAIPAGANTGKATYASNENTSSPSRKPKLDIVYLKLQNTACGGTTVIPAIADAWLNPNNTTRNYGINPDLELDSSRRHQHSLPTGAVRPERHCAGRHHHIGHLQPDDQ